MKKLLILALCSGAWCEAFAKDSDWRISKAETHIILNRSSRNIIL